MTQCQFFFLQAMMQCQENIYIEYIKIDIYLPVKRKKELYPERERERK